MKRQVIGDHWSPTGFAYDGHPYKIAPPPGVTMYEGELRALEHEFDIVVAEALKDEERLLELLESVPEDYVLLLASATEKVKSYHGGTRC